MLKKIFLPVFLLAVLTDIFAIYTGNQLLQYIFKPLILVSLIAYFIVLAVSLQPKGQDARLAAFLLDGLVLSLVGDTLLLFDADPKFFLFGLSAFLLAHIFYIISFYTILKREKLGLRFRLFIPVLVYYALLVFLLFPLLGDMRIPVLVYGMVISSMFVLALHMPLMIYKEAGKWMVLGAALFVLSDSLLAFNKFYQAFPMAGIFIMLSYAAAQYGIVKGVSAYLKEKVKVQL